MKIKSFTSEEVATWLDTFYRYCTKDEYQQRLTTMRTIFRADKDCEFWDEVCHHMKVMQEGRESAAQAEGLSPILKNYYELKKEHPEHVLWFRCGDFYETFAEDAQVTAESLGITLMRSSGVEKPMAGFPVHALDTYLPKMIRSGYRVCICDPIEVKEEKKMRITERVAPECKV